MLVFLYYLQLGINNFDESRQTSLKNRLLIDKIESTPKKKAS